MAHSQEPILISIRPSPRALREPLRRDSGRSGLCLAIDKVLGGVYHQLRCGISCRGGAGAIPKAGSIDDSPSPEHPIRARAHRKLLRRMHLNATLP